ncbi:UDP-Glycosyltransferase/glycogen phosphorylase [Trametes versicolor FP-101664 SS1]|uniref:UDP-Glycosyltransferase/glycogen phosphorylase n=1 Tax=Trametes versicolor (strain FP-101664) TaxID=717944 RepID=UPI00046221C8|nr:UDP-Glycosyltransferase/glycogen phosphorylase [Trametes versicolor FP-101664 SS1]EIW63502.1 UDP-Glycosyltransferase/glycogen phosphorylase [Trametes versicolor FP-101664 SS1]
MTATQYKHLVVFPTYFWGHSRPMCTLVARIVKLRPVHITFLTLPSLHGRVQGEVARDFQPGEEHLASRIRIIAIEENVAPNQMSGAPGAFKAAWSQLCNVQTLICAKTGASFEALPVRPSAALIDFFAVEAFDVVREVSGEGMKRYTWWAASTNSFWLVTGKDKAAAAQAEAARTGKSVKEADLDMFFTLNGRLVNSPCTPTMHDYERHPQQVILPKEEFGDILFRIGRNAHTTDGIVTIDAAEYQPEATNAIRAFYAERGSGEVFYAGPLLPSGSQAVSNEKVLAQNGTGIMNFLDEKLKSVGERSVLYLSFGSLFWPADPAKIWAVVDVLIEKNVPFIMSHGSSMASPIPDDVKARIEAYGNAIVSDWVPQQALLGHLAIGWYLTHGGHNGNMESITSGVPMIVWPIDADQPLNAIHLTEGLNVAYELIEVRNGCGLGKIYRNGRTPVGTIDAVKEEMRGVLDQAFGADGAEKRVRLQGLRTKLQAAWNEDGIARREVGAFLDEF